ncbi:hypothetical protein H7U19_13240 [Hyunsoonleella sp. SJ7]|uniref:Uncharacterized protein n=1 Tax=Hyunsoonleella aquatilis TaxID=2762758 RepID=A0A923HJB7_9FLAO|nr:hypothetical protein [Hyunsoonleella aquatilis]MBC3759377.1 hypothetical protein [Hyunsoonleella aquatilis]
MKNAELGGMVFEKVNDNEMYAFMDIKNKYGSTETYKVNYIKPLGLPLILKNCKFGVCSA